MHFYSKIIFNAFFTTSGKIYGISTLRWCTHCFFLIQQQINLLQTRSKTFFYSWTYWLPKIYIKTHYMKSIIIKWNIFFQTRMLRAILNKSWQQHPTKRQLYGQLPPITKTIQARRTRHAGHCWRSKNEIISDVLLWTPAYGQSKAGRPARTYIQQLCDDTGCNPEDLPEAMNDRETWREWGRDICAGRTTWWWWWWWCRGNIWNNSKGWVKNFNVMPTRLGLFHTKRLRNSVRCSFYIYTFVVNGLNIVWELIISTFLFFDCPVGWGCRKSPTTSLLRSKTPSLNECPRYGTKQSDD